MCGNSKWRELKRYKRPLEKKSSCDLFVHLSPTHALTLPSSKVTKNIVKIYVVEKNLQLHYPISFVLGKLRSNSFPLTLWKNFCLTVSLSPSLPPCLPPWSLERQGREKKEQNLISSEERRGTRSAMRRRGRNAERNTGNTHDTKENNVEQQYRKNTPQY